MSRTVTIADVVMKTKASSSKWVKTRWPVGFSWQSGYGAFSIGVGEVGRMAAYIRGQEAHHAKTSFQDEYRTLLTEAGIDFDERYVWD